MVRTCLSAAVILVLFFPVASGLTFEVDVAELTDHSIKDLNHSDEVETVQEINGTIENIGSIGCTYRLKAEFEQGNETFERFSSPYSLWQGDYIRGEILYVPMNYTGTVDTDLSVTYCGQEKNVSSFSFNVTENTLPEQEMESRTVEASEDSATVELEEGEKLVPEEEPSYWKTSSAEINNRSAQIEYDAPIFEASETITYSVLEDEEVIGRTEVQLEPEHTLTEKLWKQRMKILGGLLLLSVLGNLLLYLRHRGLLEKLVPDYELPELKRDE